MNVIEEAKQVLVEIDAKLTQWERDVTAGPWHWVKDDDPVDYTRRYDDVIEEAQDTHLLGVSLRSVGPREPASDMFPDLPTFLSDSEEITKSDAAFIAASRTGWPTALRMLKTSIETLLADKFWNYISQAYVLRHDSLVALTTLIKQWRAQQ